MITMTGVGAARGPVADVAGARERARQRRLTRLALLLAPLAGWLWYRLLSGDPVGAPGLPVIDPFLLMAGLLFGGMFVALIGTTVVAGRSPHVMYRPDQFEVTLDDVVGLDAVTAEARRSLDLFLAGRSFRRGMGGTPRRGVLFEGPPGTGKTHLAKAMAAEAGVPFLFVSATSFQSMYYGATARRIRSYFNALRKAARAEGGAIGFIEEIDAIALSRGGMLGMSAASGAASPARVLRSGVVNEGVSGVVNELLVQLQSFDALTGRQRALGKVADWANLFLPVHRQLPRPRPEPVDLLLIAATNRADALDPALLRPGRFDRTLTFEAPDRAGRRALIDYFLTTKAHESELDDAERRDALAGLTGGYTPVMLERLFDEALVNAVQRQAAGMNWADLTTARLVTEVGLGHPVRYTPRELSLIATHEAGHAVAAWLLAPGRRLDVLTVVKRAGTLGLLAHSDTEEVYTRSRSELEGFLSIALAGQAAEEIFFGDVSTGPSSDLASATATAAQMVGAAGMSGSLVSFARGGAVDPGLTARVLGDATARAAVEELLDRQKQLAVLLLDRNRHLVAALRDALVERKELIGSEITEVLLAAEARRQAEVEADLEADPEVGSEVGSEAAPGEK